MSLFLLIKVQCNPCRALPSATECIAVNDYYCKQCIQDGQMCSGVDRSIVTTYEEHSRATRPDRDHDNNPTTQADFGTVDGAIDPPIEQTPTPRSAVVQADFEMADATADSTVAEHPTPVFQKDSEMDDATADPTVEEKPLAAPPASESSSSFLHSQHPDAGVEPCSGLPFLPATLECSQDLYVFRLPQRLPSRWSCEGHEDPCKINDMSVRYNEAIERARLNGIEAYKLWCKIQHFRQLREAVTREATVAPC